jgi:hypothetical protein
MENLDIIVAFITVLFIIAALYFNKEINRLFNQYHVEPFNVDNSNIGLKWIYYSNREPNDGEKINRQTLYDILKLKFVYPVIISQDTLDSLNIENITYDTYIDVDGRFFKPYNPNKLLAYNAGRKWIKLGREDDTENYVLNDYTEILNNSIKEAIKAKIAEEDYEDIDGENVITFDRREYANMKGDTNITHDSYIIVDDNIYQPLYPTEYIASNVVEGGSLNLDYIKSSGMDASFSGSTGINTQNSMDTYSSTDAYKTDATNAELSMNTNYMYYRQSGDDLEKTILDPIEDTYLPYNDEKYKSDPEFASTNNINEFVIIDVYKKLLNRHPRPQELNKNLQDFYEKLGNEEKLKMKIYNSTEYKMIVKMQSNDVEPGLIRHISHTKLIDSLKPLYKQHYEKNLPDKMLVPLKQCYIHLQYNDYLFKAMLMHDKYIMFEKAVIREYIMTDKKLLDIFNKHFVLYELRLIANELKRRDIIKRKAFETPIALHTDSSKNAASSTDNSDTAMNSGKQISDIVKDGNSVFNINITLNDKNKDESKPYSMTTEIINNNMDNRDMSTSDNSITKEEASGDSDGSDGSGGSGVSGGSERLDGIPEYKEHPDYGTIYNKEDGKANGYNTIKRDKSYRMGNRIYNPITYKQQYRGHPGYRPNVCSYGTEQVVNPVLLKNSNLFQGTDLEDAFKNTQIGSIMPKFEYREYEEIN